MLLFSQLPTARPQQQPVAPPALAAAHRASASRPSCLDLPLPHDLDLQQSAAGRHPPLLGLASGARNEGGAQETNAGAKMVDLRCGAGRSYGTVAPPPSLASRERVYRGSSDGAAFPHPVWQGSAWSRSPFWSPAKQGLISGLN